MKEGAEPCFQVQEQMEGAKPNFQVKEQMKDGEEPGFQEKKGISQGFRNKNR